MLYIYAKNNLVMVNVYIKDPVVTRIWRDEKTPIIHFVAYTGGLLGLSYDSPDLKTSNRHLRLFCTSPRLLPCGTIASSPALSFDAPACLRAKKYPDKVKNCLRNSF